MWLSPNEVCIGVAVSVKNICARFITVSVKKLLHYRAGGLLQYRAVLLHYRAVITVSGVFITLSGSYYSIGRLLHYRLVQLSLGLLLLDRPPCSTSSFWLSFFNVVWPPFPQPRLVRMPTEYSRLNPTFSGGSTTGPLGPGPQAPELQGAPKFSTTKILGHNH